MNSFAGAAWAAALLNHKPAAFRWAYLRSRKLLLSRLLAGTHVEEVP